MRRLAVLVALVLGLTVLTAPTSSARGDHQAVSGAPDDAGRGFTQRKFKKVADPSGDVRVSGRGCGSIPGMRALDVRRTTVALKREGPTGPWKVTASTFVKDVPSPTAAYRRGPAFEFFVYADGRYYGSAQVSTYFFEGRVTTSSESRVGSDPAAGSGVLDESGAVFKRSATVKFTVPDGVKLAITARASLSRTKNRRDCFGYDARKNAFGPTTI